MRTLSISSAKARLNELVEDTQRTQEHVTLTKNGAPAVVMVSADEWESIQETIFWLSQPGIRDDVSAAGQDAADGRVVGADELRGQYGLRRLHSS